MNANCPLRSRTPLTRLAPELGDPVSAFWPRLLRSVRLLRKQADWDRFAGPDWPERIMHLPLTDREHRKQGRSIGRKIFTEGGDTLSVYLKRHFRLSWWRGWMATLFPNAAWSPGLQEWLKLRWALAEGFPVPRAVAAGQFVGPWGKLQSFLAVEELHGMLPLHEAIPLALGRLEGRAFLRWKRGLVAELARLARELHIRSVFHKDFYLCHFYIPETLTRTIPADWSHRVILIDLHRLARHTLTRIVWQVKDLAQLCFSSDIAGITARDRLRFWKYYRAQWPRERTPGHWLVPLVRWKTQLYVRHRRRRPDNIVAFQDHRRAA